MTRQIRCGEIWGGIKRKSEECETNGIVASLFSQSCDGNQGGDIYYFSVCNSDKLSRVVIADVMGHGEKVSHTSKWLYDSLVQNMDSLDGTEVFQGVNQRAMTYGHQALSVATVASFYSEDQSFSFTYAGHHPILVLRSENRKWELATGSENTGSFPIGLIGEASYDQKQITMKSGDKFMIYTDGVTETLSPDGEIYGIDSLMKVLESSKDKTPKEISTSVLGSVEEFSSGNLSHDDLTFIVAAIK